MALSQCIFIPPGPYTMTEINKQLKLGRGEGEIKGKTEEPERKRAWICSEVGRKERARGEGGKITGKR